MNATFLEILNWTILGNSVRLWLLTVAVFVTLYLCLALLRTMGLRVLHDLARRSRFMADDTFLDTLKSIPGILWFLIALLLALRIPFFPPIIERIIIGALMVIVVGLAIVLLQRILIALLLAYVPHFRRENQRELPAILQMSIIIVLWTFGILLILSNLGINVISLVAGLGIGGLAIALAMQNILGDIFSSFSLYFDRPFREGDFIIVGQHMGTVKKIGLKTTRIQSLQGEEIIISNQELTTSRVQNYKRMFERRVELKFGIPYDTPLENIRAIPPAIKAFVEKKEHVRFDRAHFTRFGEYQLEFEVIYIMKTPDYNQYMDMQQAINLELMEYFAREGIEFALPTRVVQQEEKIPEKGGSSVHE